MTNFRLMLQGSLFTLLLLCALDGVINQRQVVISTILAGICIVLSLVELFRTQ